MLMTLVLDSFFGKGPPPRTPPNQIDHRRKQHSHVTFFWGGGRGSPPVLPPAHAGRCGSRCASRSKWPNLHYNTNPHRSPRVAHMSRKGMDIQYTHCGHRGIGWGLG